MPDALLYVLIAIAVLIVLIVVLRTISGRGAAEDHVETTASTAADPTPATPAVEAPEPTDEGDGIADGFAAAVTDVVGEFTGVEAHPDTPGDTEVGRADDDGSGGTASIAQGGAGDALTQIKGLGPKAAKGLTEMGVVRFEQIAGWTEGDVATVGEKLGGTFAQRIARDRWIEQAGLLARGERDAFEAEFGKLG